MRSLHARCTQASLPIAGPKGALSMLIHRHREDPVSISQAAQEIGRAVLDEYGGALSSESMILDHGQIVGLTPGTYRKLLRAIRRGVRATKGCLPTT